MLEQRSSHVKLVRMATRAARAERRTDALSKQRIVEAAIALLDTGGESALTFRALAARLATGSGAIYWHVANKDELLAAATDEIVTRVVTGTARGGAGHGRDADPRAAIRAVTLGVFDAIDAHPWVGTQLSRTPWLTAIPRLFESIGGQLEALGVPEDAQFDATSALVNYTLGVAGQNAANARLHEGGTGRVALLGAVAERWAGLDPARYPFVRRVAAQLPGHDDRGQFLAGVDLILAGAAAIRCARAPAPPGVGASCRPWSCAGGAVFTARRRAAGCGRGRWSRVPRVRARGGVPWGSARCRRSG
jgi:AcrR family transcriptional regulator